MTLPVPSAPSVPRGIAPCPCLQGIIRCGLAEIRRGTMGNGGADGDPALFAKLVCIVTRHLCVYRTENGWAQCPTAATAGTG